MRKLLLILFSTCILQNCAFVTYSETLPSGVTRAIDVKLFATDREIDGFVLVDKPDGSKEIQLQGYTVDQTKAVAVAVDAAIKAAISSVKP